MAQVMNVGRREKDDVLGVIMKGLQIAQGVYGIKTNMAQLDEFERKQAEAQAEKDRIAQGRLNPTEKLALGDKYTFSREQSEGAIKLSDDQGALFAIPKAKDPKLLTVDTVDERGRPVQKVVEAKAGETFLKAPTQRKQELMTVETVDAQGRPVTMTVPKQAGQVFLKPPPQQSPIQTMIADERLRNKIIKYEEKTQPLATLFGTISEVEKTIGFNLDQYDPKTNTAGGQPVDVPGVSVPGIGRVSVTQEARSVRDRAAKIFNQELKDRSGAAVTTPEMERLKTEFSEGKFNTEAELLTALKLYKDEARRAFARREAAFGKEVVDRFKSEGGFTLSDTFESNELKDEDLIDEILRRQQSTAGQ